MRAGGATQTACPATQRGPISATRVAKRPSRFMNRRGKSMSIRRIVLGPFVKIFALAAFVFSFVPPVATGQSEWLTWGHDPERTGSNPNEKILNKDNVSQLELKWTAQISTAPKEYV